MLLVIVMTNANDNANAIGKLKKNTTSRLHNNGVLNTTYRFVHHAICGSLLKSTTTL